jgi:hypothetical protein
MARTTTRVDTSADQLYFFEIKLISYMHTLGQFHFAGPVLVNGLVGFSPCHRTTATPPLDFIYVFLHFL